MLTTGELYMACRINSPPRKQLFFFTCDMLPFYNIWSLSYTHGLDCGDEFQLL